jgi:hypothetical protein
MTNFKTKHGTSPLSFTTIFDDPERHDRAGFFNSNWLDMGNRANAAKKLYLPAAS